MVVYNGGIIGPKNKAEYVRTTGIWSLSENYTLVKNQLSSQYREAVLADNPFGYWTLEEYEPPFRDYSGNQRNADGSVTETRVSGAILGEDSRAVRGGGLSVPANLGATSKNTITAEWWHRGSQEPTTQFWGLGPRRKGTDGWAPDVRGTGASATIGVRIDTTGGTNQVRNIPRATVNVWDGQWHHIVLTLSSGSLQWFVDGVRVSTTTYNHGNGFNFSSTDRNIGLTIGQSFVEGQHFAIYNYVLSSTRILAHYNAAKNI